MIYLAVTKPVPVWTRRATWTVALLASKSHFGDWVPDTASWHSELDNPQPLLWS